MELNALFPNLNVMWTRWSEYTLVKNEISGPYIDFLAPAPGAAALTFNCADHPETLVADALELGRQLFLGAPEKDRLCAVFAARHGLLGLEAEKDTPFDDRPEMPPFCQPLNSREYGWTSACFRPALWNCTSTSCRPEESWQQRQIRR